MAETVKNETVVTQEVETPTVEVKPQENEVKNVTFSEKEFEERLTNKYAEGARKAESKLLQDLGISTKEDLKKVLEGAGAKDDVIKDWDNKYNNLSKETEQLKAERLVMSKGADVNTAENVVALIKGKGLEVNEENITATLELFNKANRQSFGTAQSPQGGEVKKAPAKVF